MWQTMFVPMAALVLGAVGFFTFGLNVGLMIAIAMLVLWSVYQTVYFYRLRCWLDGKGELPTAMGWGFGRNFGDWQVVFDKLHHKQIQNQNHKQRLTANINRLNRIILAIPNAILIVNKKGEIEYKNSRADEYLGQLSSHQSLKGQINDGEFSAFFDNAVINGGASDVKVTLGHKVLLMTLTPIEADANLIIAHDITASEQLGLSKSAFIANVSHELRTPLTVIAGFLETLHDNELDRMLQIEFITLMQKQSGRMLDLINDLLTLSRLENESDELKNAEPVLLSAMIDDICTDAGRTETHYISTEIMPDVWVCGVHQELYSIFHNLIINAVRHTEQGTNVMVSLAVDDKVTFMVKDNGDGIDVKHINHLTERFYRVDKGRSRKTGGSGLGLAIAKYAINRHGGTLHIDSQVGKGSVFTVILPKK